MWKFLSKQRESSPCLEDISRCQTSRPYASFNQTHGECTIKANPIQMTFRRVFEVPPNRNHRYWHCQLHVRSRMVVSGRSRSIDISLANTELFGWVSPKAPPCRAKIHEQLITANLRITKRERHVKEWKWNSNRSFCSGGIFNMQ